MKNIFKTSLFINLFALLAVSCSDEYYVTEQHFDGNWVFSEEYDIGGSSRYSWHYDSPGIYYCDVQIKELTQQIYDEGMIATYFVHYVNDIKVDSPLPFDYFDMDNTGYQWTYQYTCEISPGWITFVFKDSSFFEENPPACTFVVKMMR